MSDTPYIDIVFDGPPSHKSGRFVETESPAGVGVHAGEWIDRGDGFWALRIPNYAAGWRPIETAPKNGTVIIGYDRKTGNSFTNYIEFLRWEDGEWRDPETYKRRPSHWMPLPEGASVP